MKENDSKGARAWILDMLFGREHSSLAGDIEEMRARMKRERGTVIASFWFWSQVLRALPHYACSLIYWRSSMLLSYLKVAIRVMNRQRSLTLINMTGLAAGMACCLLIVLFIQDEFSFDRYNEKIDRICRIGLSARMGGTDFEVASTSAPLAGIAVEEIPGVTGAVRFRGIENAVFSYGDKSFREERVTYADPSLFDLFSIDLLRGETGSALTGPDMVIIDRSTAQKYFGAEDPVGRTITLNDSDEFTVTGIYADLPSNSHFHFNIFVSMKSFRSTEMDIWTNSNFHTYLLLGEDVDPAEVEAQFPPIVKKHIAPVIQEIYNKSIDDLISEGKLRWNYFLQPLGSIHLHSHLYSEIETNGDMRNIYILGSIAVLILVIASINFVNLSTARGAGRAREVGIRKVSGSNRSSLVRQFLAETVVLCILAGAAAILIVNALLPWFDSITGKEMSTADLFTGWTSLWILGTVLVTGLAAGIYPALYLSSFEPVRVLKSGTIASGSRGTMRGVLVITQMTISITLVALTLLVGRQLRFLGEVDPGYDAEQVIIVENTHTLGESAKTFRDAVISDNRISAGTVTGYLPVDSERTYSGVFPDSNRDDELTTNVAWFHVDNEYVSTFGLRVVEGRGFSSEYPSDDRTALINETMAALFEWDDPLEHRVSTFDDDAATIDYQVIGVVKDFHYESLHYPVDPLIIILEESWSRVSFRIDSDKVENVIPFIEDEFNKFASGKPFEYRFLDDDFARYYAAEQKLGKIFTAFSSLAIIIGCLGLIGLASFMASQRTKEIGVRKVLGASTGSIVYMLLKEFSRWIIIANVIAIPVAWMMMDKWLSNFTCRTEIGLGIFVTASALTLAVGLLSVIWQVGRAASADPVRSLKYE